MERKAISGMILTLLITSMLTLAFRIEPVSAYYSPAVYVDPISTINPTLVPGSTYTIEIMTDYTGDDITAYQFSLTWNPNVLEGIEVANGDIVTGEGTGFANGTFDNTAGTLGLSGALCGNPADTVSGPGVLANVTFGVVGTGTSSITLGSDVQLIAWNGTDVEFIVDGATMPDHLSHGYFSNSPSPIEVLEELIETIETWNLHKGTENSLEARLKVAIHMLDMGKEDGATRKLTAFINRVEMLREKTLMNEQADCLISEAQRIIDLING